ncbi:MAG: right-handed parallel beta-helix repeat-containing protein [bacterium]|nr:right-handed parallel beta-helix repeat-containing protein [bacterium]
MRHFLILSILALWATAALAQTIRVANNNANVPTGVNIYPTLQKAIDEATPGDLIHVIPSTTTYGNIKIDRRLTILGIGFHPDKEVALKSEVGNVKLSEGSEGTRLAGLKINSIGGGVDNFTIESCQTSEINFFAQIPNTALTLNNIVIRNCVITGTGRVRLIPKDASSNVIISNNIFMQAALVISGITGVVITNNVFTGLTEGPESIHDGLHNALVTNNILFARTVKGLGSFYGYKNNTFRNNIVWGSGDNEIPTIDDNTESNNQKGVDPQFVNFPEKGTRSWSFDFDLRLRETSPGKNAGDDGTDIGIYGGVNPFDPTGTPLPYVQSIVVPSAVKVGTDLKVTIRARGN